MVLRHRVVYGAEDAAQLLKVAESAWRSWVKSRRRENANPDLLQATGDFIQISEIRRAKWEQVRNGQIAAVRLTDVVDAGFGEYSVVISWVGQPDGAWVQIDGFAPDAESLYQPPKISHELFAAASESELILFDAFPEIRFTPAPQVIGVDKIDKFVSNVLEHPERTTLALVAGTDSNADQRQWRDALEQKIYPKVVGMATMWLLTPDATEYFNRNVPEIYQVLPTTIHAFRPNLNLRHIGDGARHRYFTRSSIAEALIDNDSERYLQNRLYYLARSTSLGIKLPQPLLDADELFDDREVEQQADSFLKYSIDGEDLHSNKLREALQQRRRNSAPKIAELDSAAKRKPNETHTGEHVSKTETSPKVAEPQNKDTKSDLKPGLPLNHAISESTHAGDISSQSPASGEAARVPLQALEELKKSSFVLETLEMLLDSSQLSGYGIDSTEEGLITLVDFAEKGSDADLRFSNFRNTYVEQGQRLKQLEKDIENLQLELEESDRRQAELLDNNRALYRGLMSANAAPEAYALAEARPESITELLERIKEEFPHLVFTGDRRKAEALDDRTQSTKIASRTWEALQVLEDYAMVFNEHGSVARFLRSEHTIQQFKVDHAPSESDSVSSNSKFRQARELPVPRTVDPIGKVYMEAHFKITNDGGKAPRMHYYDAMKDDQRIYIGYLGAHLPNTMTS